MIKFLSKDFTKAKAGFTLAEVLITLGIIGIVSAMTIPTLLGKINKTRTEAMVKEDYAIMQQVIKLAESQDAAISITDSADGMKLWFDMYIQPNLKTVSICYETPGCWNSGDTYNLRGGVANSNKRGIGVGGGIIIFTLPNGSSICIDGWSEGDMEQLFGIKTSGSSLVMYIDTNGSKLPNTIGKDIYIMGWKDGNLVPAGSDVSIAEVYRNCSKTASGSNPGYYCLRKFMTNGWKIDTY